MIREFTLTDGPSREAMFDCLRLGRNTLTLRTVDFWGTYEIDGRRSGSRFDIEIEGLHHKSGDEREWFFYGSRAFPTKGSRQFVFGSWNTHLRTGTIQFGDTSFFTEPPSGPYRLRVVVGEGFRVTASQVLERLRFDRSLPDRAAYEKLRAAAMRNPDEFPPDYRHFRLLFPAAYQQGLHEGGGADRVTDDTFPVLGFQKGKWQESNLSTGEMWGGHRDDAITDNDRVLVIAS